MPTNLAYLIFWGGMVQKLASFRKYLNHQTPCWNSWISRQEFHLLSTNAMVVIQPILGILELGILMVIFFYFPTVFII
jgi:hypothetical protein